MAKKKSASSDVVKVDEVPDSELDNAFLKKFGKNLTSYTELTSRVSALIPVSPALDYVLGGGIHEGSMAIITGKPKIGKTSTCLDFAATAQSIPCALLPEGEKRKIFIMSVEHRLKSRDLLSIKGLDPNYCFIIESKPENPMDAEGFIGATENIINTMPGSVIIFDSFSALCTKGEKEADIAVRYRADSPLLISRFIRRTQDTLRMNKCILLGITHEYANQGNGPSESKEASGTKIQYGLDIKLRAQYSEAIKVGETQIGQKIHWICTTTSTNMGPNRKCEGILRYGHGLDKEYELIQLCQSLNIIEGDVWLLLPNGKKLQGKDKASAYLRENRDVYDELDKKYREMVGLIPNEVSNAE